MSKPTKNIICFVSDVLGIKIKFVFINKELTKLEKETLEPSVWEVCRNLFISNFRATIVITADRSEVESMFFKISLKFYSFRYKHESNYINTPSTFLVATNALDNMSNELQKLNYKRVLNSLAKDLEDPKV
ncbi:MAG: hypothetical protein AAB334_00635 [Patescibacteria group bacterium]